MYKEFWDRLQLEGVFDLVAMKGWLSVKGSKRDDYSPKDVLQYLLDNGDQYYPDWTQAAIEILYGMQKDDDI